MDSPWGGQVTQDGVRVDSLRAVSSFYDDVTGEFDRAPHRRVHLDAYIHCFCGWNVHLCVSKTTEERFVFSCVGSSLVRIQSGQDLVWSGSSSWTVEVCFKPSCLKQLVIVDCFPVFHDFFSINMTNSTDGLDSSFLLIASISYEIN